MDKNRSPRTDIELAWSNGPWRVKGTGNGKLSVYVCGRCLISTVGVYHVKQRRKWAQNWLCDACRSKLC